MEYDSIIFTHIPKCGGTSFRQYFNASAISSGINKDQIYIPGFNGLKNESNFDQLNKEQLDALTRQKLLVIAAHCKYNVHREYSLSIQRPFYYTVLRDPVQRFISHYNYFYFSLGYRDLMGVTLNDLSDEQFNFIARLIGDLQVRYLANFKYPKILGSENMLKLAKYNLEYEYGCFGLLDFAADSIELLRASGIPWIKFSSTDLPQRNIGKASYKISEKVLSRIREANKLDVNLYKFANELWAKMVRV